MAIFTGVPISYDPDRKWQSATSQGNMYTNHTSNTYSQINLTTGASAETMIKFNFDLSSIPRNTVINSVSCVVKCYLQGASANYSYRKVHLMSGDVEKNGEGYTIPQASTTPFTATTVSSTWTRAELDDFKLRVKVLRSSQNVNSNYYMRFYGATLYVDYTEVQASNFVKKHGVWTAINKAFKKENGAWVENSDLTQVFENDKIYVIENE